VTGVLVFAARDGARGDFRTPSLIPSNHIGGARTASQASQQMRLLTEGIEDMRPYAQDVHANLRAAQPTGQGLRLRNGLPAPDRRPGSTMRNRRHDGTGRDEPEQRHLFAPFGRALAHSLADAIAFSRPPLATICRAHFRHDRSFDRRLSGMLVHRRQLGARTPSVCRRTVFGSREAGRAE
jgi:hypothetical protein